MIICVTVLLFLGGGDAKLGLRYHFCSFEVLGHAKGGLR
jgi:hypothetical protein